jgi:small subunit ribosomal protein S9
MAKKKIEEIWATGRRKCAAARVRIKAGKGQLTINKRAFDEYFPDAAIRSYICQPLVISGTAESFDITANIKGGGSVGQAGALRHGIARALMGANPELRAVLKESGMIALLMRPLFGFCKSSKQ